MMVAEGVAFMDVAAGVAATALAKAMPYAQHRTLEGQTHELSVDVLAPLLVEFFNSDAAS